MTVLPQLKRDLLDAHPRVVSTLAPEPARRTRLRPVRSLWRAAPLFAAVAVPIVVAAIVLVGHDGGSSRPVSPLAARGPAGSGIATLSVTERSTRRALVASLGVLRRPQTALDGAARFQILPRGKVPTVVSRRLGFPRADPSLSRVVSLPSLRGRLLFLPVTFRPPHSAHRVEGLTVALRLPHNESSTGIKAITVGQFHAHGLLSATVYGRTSTALLAVPDGVARVTLGPVTRDRPSPMSTTPVSPQTVTVRDNLAIVSSPVPTATSRRFQTALDFVSAHLQETWIAPGGQVIRRFTVAFELPAQVRHTGPGVGCIAEPYLNDEGCDGP